MVPQDLLRWPERLQTSVDPPDVALGRSSSKARPTYERLSGTLGRLAGACVQLAKALRESRDPAHPAAEATLAEVRDAARKAVALVEALR